MRIGRLSSYRGSDGASVVEADVDGERLWFASNDADLAPSAEAFMSALLVPAASRGEVIFLDEALDRTWLGSVPDILEQLKTWWDFPALES